MFDNTGKNIMRLSAAFFPVCCALTLALGIFAWAQLRAASVSGFLCALAFLAVLAAGCFFSWAAAQVLYAFGQIAEDLHQLRLDRAMEGSGSHASSYAKAGYTLPGQPAPPAPRQRRSQAGRERREAAQTGQRPAEERPAEKPAGAAAPVPPADMIGRSGWIQADSIYIQCPRCGSRMTPEFALTHRGCPQCGTPYQP